MSIPIMIAMAIRNIAAIAQSCQSMTRASWERICSMDESALRTLLNNLDASRSSWHGLLHVFTFLVIVGLGVDLFVIIKEFWDDIKEFRYGQVHSYEIHLPKRPSAAVLIFGLIGTALIVIGVWGELYVDVKVGKVESDIRAANDALLGLIIQEAGDAKTSAEGAALAAARANAEAGKAQQNVGKVAEQANALAARIANADSHLSQLEAQASKTKSDLINLAICNAPRVISNWFVTGGGGTKSYADSLRPMAGQVVFIEVVPDAEARRAALNIARTLEDAHWSVQEPLKFVDGIADGISVQPFVSPHSRMAPESMGKPDSYWRAIEVAGLAADQLLDFLHSYNWQAKIGWTTDSHLNIVDEKVLPIGAIRIQVGLYPPAVYVNPPGQKEFTTSIEEMNEEMKRAEGKRMAEFERDREKRLATLPPELRRKVQQMRDEMEADNKMRNARAQWPMPSLESALLIGLWT